MTTFLFIKAEKTEINQVVIDVVTQLANIEIDRAWWTQQLREDNWYDSVQCNTAIIECNRKHEGIYDEFKKWLLENNFTDCQVLTLQNEVAKQVEELRPSLKVLKDAQEKARFELYRIMNDFKKQNFKERYPNC